MRGALTKGALVEYLPTMPPTPVVTVFQYNPESMTHTWTQPQPQGKPGAESNNPLAVPGMPGETFQFTIFLDADDDIVDGTPTLKQAAQKSGVGARLAALEMLLYPVSGTQSSGGNGGLVGTASASANSSASPTWTLPNSTLPVVLFFWNSNRVVPVRVTTLTITETLYDKDLNPTHAQAQLSLRVLTPTELAATNPAPGTPAALAVTAYKQTYATRSKWASSSTAGPPVSITDKLPH
jgi:hypothetical protein